MALYLVISILQEWKLFHEAKTAAKGSGKHFRHIVRKNFSPVASKRCFFDFFNQCFPIARLFNCLVSPHRIIVNTRGIKSGK